MEEALPAIRLTPDEWHLRLFGQDIEHPQHDMRHDTIEALLWELAGRILAHGVDVILDFGFWSRSERDEFRRRAAQLGAVSIVHYLPTRIEEILSRLAARDTAETFRISEEMILKWSQMFEPPTDDELVA